ncbi:MAG: hypothetical protein AAF713_08660 [Pseudomonadota bacterium]
MSDAPLLLDLTDLITHRHAKSPSLDLLLGHRYAVHAASKPAESRVFAMAGLRGLTVLPDREVASLLVDLDARWLRGVRPLQSPGIARLELMLEDPADLSAGTVEERRRLADHAGAWVWLGPGLAESRVGSAAGSLLQRKALRAAVLRWCEVTALDSPGFGPPPRAERPIADVFASVPCALIAQSDNLARRIAGLTERAVPHVLPPGPLFPTAPEAADGPPIFAAFGPVTAASNLTALLTAWRQMAERRGLANTPKLEILGPRCPSAPSAAALLDRCPALAVPVMERPQPTLREMAATLDRTTAVLAPDLASDWPLPVAEAVARGVPVVAADLPEMREAGGAAPTYLSPVAMDRWLAEIARLEDLPREAGHPPRRNPQPSPGWDAHLASLDELVRCLAAQTGDRRAPPPPGERLAVQPPIPAAETLLPVRPPLEPAKALIDSADSRRDLGDFAAAAEGYAGALRHDPNVAAHWVQLGHMLKEIGGFDGAEACYRKAQALTPDDPDLDLQMGHLANRRGRPGNALELYHLALARAPHDAEIAHHIAETERRFALLFGAETGSQPD